MTGEKFKDDDSYTSLRYKAGYLLATLSLLNAAPALAQVKSTATQRRLNARIQNRLNYEVKQVNSPFAMKKFDGRAAVSAERHGNKVTLDDSVAIKYGLVDLNVTAPESKKGKADLNNVSRVAFSETIEGPVKRPVEVVRLVASKRPDGGGWVLRVRDEDPYTHQVFSRQDSVTPQIHERSLSSEGATSFLDQIRLIAANAEAGDIPPRDFGPPEGF